MKLMIREVDAKSVLNPSKLGSDYAVNPYNGCVFGCAYCYATFMGRMNHKGENWGEWIDVKINAPQLLEKEIINKKAGSIFFSSVTDPYQGLESKYQLTRKCLEILVKNKYSSPIFILTKSPLVVRDIDLLKKLNTEVGLTVTSTGDPITKLIETNAPSHQSRLRALKELHQAGIKTYAFVGPLLPHLVEKPDELKNLFTALKDAGVDKVWIEHLNLSPYIKKRLFTFIAKNLPKQLEKFKMLDDPRQRQKLNELLKQILSEIKFGSYEIIYHKDEN